MSAAVKQTGRAVHAGDLAPKRRMVEGGVPSIHFASYPARQYGGNDKIY